MYQRKVDVDMLNAVKSVLADVLSVSPLSEQKDEVLRLETSANTLFTAFGISTSTLRWYIVRSTWISQFSRELHTYIHELYFSVKCI